MKSPPFLFFAWCLTVQRIVVAVVAVAVVIGVMRHLIVHGITSKESVTARSIVFILPFVEILHESPIGSGQTSAGIGEEGGVVEMIVLGAGTENGEAGAHSATAADDSEHEEEYDDDDGSDLLSDVFLLLVVVISV